MTTVRVYCRMRPFNNREKELGNLEYPIEIHGDEVAVPEKAKTYNFDSNFGPASSQEQVFQVIGTTVVRFNLFVVVIRRVF